MFNQLPFFFYINSCWKCLPIEHKTYLEFCFVTATDSCTTNTWRSTSINPISFRASWTAWSFRWTYGTTARTSKSPEKSARSSSRRHQSSTCGTISRGALGRRISWSQWTIILFYFCLFSPAEKLRVTSRSWEVSSTLTARHRIGVEASKRRYKSKSCKSFLVRTAES